MMKDKELKSKNEVDSNHSRADQRIRAAAVQMESVAGDKAVNFIKIESFLEKAAQQAVKIIVFPECCITGYWFIRKLKLMDFVTCT